MPDSWMSAHEVDQVDRLVEQLGRLRPLIEKHRGSFDEARRLPKRVFEALCDIGAFRLFLPRALGGLELSPHGFMRVVEAASELDGSVGWLVGNGGGMSRVGGYLAPEVAGDWFADRRAFVASSTGAVGEAVPVDGGYRVTGRWPFGSGIHHATWAMGLCAVAPAATSSELVCCHLPAGSVSIVDNWFVSGMRGTGSCDFEARDVFVPAAHAHRFMDPPPTQSNVLYRLPVASIYPLTVSVVPLGIARATISSFIGLAATTSRRGMSAALRDREIVQAEVGRAEALHHAARAFLVEAITELMMATDMGGDRLIRARALFRAACAHAAESAVRIVDMLSTVSGSISIFESAPLERCARDVHAAVKHVAMSPNNYVIAGRICMGLDAGVARF
ncbi:MAG: hypothetical protein KF889_21380 [Alphaproteobacteria bacterium]|nr:hypothetical protein [Alphaproteobacteria bacterium]MCW5743192.1 hypothetical protein [Alphaproteobacteria bacterium]